MKIQNLKQMNVAVAQMKKVAANQMKIKNVNKI
jgi:hypothetical protein